MFPEPELSAEIGNVPLPPVLAVSVHLLSLPVVPVSKFPEILLQTTPAVAGDAADAVPAKLSERTETGNAHKATTPRTRRMYFPLTRGFPPLLWIDPPSQAPGRVLV